MGDLTRIDRAEAVEITDGVSQSAAVKTSSPTGTEGGLVVRNVPSGTQTVAGTVTLSSQTVTVASGTVVANGGSLNAYAFDGSGNSIPSSTAALAGTERGLIVRNLPSGTQTVTGTVTNVPSGTQTVAGTVTLSSQTVTVASGTVVNNGGSVLAYAYDSSGNAIASSTAALTGAERGLVVRTLPSGTQTVTGTVTNVPSGTQTVAGTVTLSSQTVTVASGTVVANGGSVNAYVFDGSGNSIASSTAALAGTERGLIVRNLPSGTQTVTGTVTNVPSGTQTVAGTVTLSSQTVTVASGTVVNNGGSVLAYAYDSSGNAIASSTAALAGTERGLVVRNLPSGTQTVTGTVTLSSQTVTVASGTVVNNGGSVLAYAYDSSGNAIASSTAALAGTERGLVVRTLPSGTQTVTGTVDVTSLSAASDTVTATGTVTSVPSGTQTVTGTVASTGTVSASTLAATEVIGTASSAAVLTNFPVDCQNYRWVSVHITSGASSTFTWVFECSNDNTNWQNAALMLSSSLQSTASSGTSVTSATANLVYHGPLPARYFRVRLSAWTVGTCTATAEFYQVPATPQTIGGSVVLSSGQYAHNAAIGSSNPVLTAGYASSTAPTAVTADGTAVRSWFDRNGRVQVNGDSSMTALKVDGSGVTQPVSGTVALSSQTVTVASGTVVNNGGSINAYAFDGSGNSIPSSTAALAGTERGLIVRNLPSGTQTVTGTVAIAGGGSTYVANGGSVNAWAYDGSGNAIASSTAALAGTERGLVVRNLPSGTQTVAGTVTLSSQTVTLSSQTVTVASGTVVANGGSVNGYIFDGSGNSIPSSTAALTGTERGLIVRNLPSGTQTVTGTVTNVPSGTQTVTGTINVGNTVSGTIVNNGGSVNAYAYDSSGNAIASSTAALAGTERGLVVRNLPSGTQTVTGTVTLSSQTVTVASGTVVNNGGSVTASGTVSAVAETSAVTSAGTSLTPLYAAFGGATAGDNTLIAAVASKKIRVLAFMGIAAAAQSLYFTSGAAGTVIFGSSTNKISVTANGGFVLPFNPVGWFETSAGAALICNLSTATAFSGGITYVTI